MTGRLEGFVNRKSAQAPPPSTQPQPQPRNGRTDRSVVAATFKVKRGEKTTINPQPFGLPLANTAPAPGYNTSHPTDRNTFPNRHYEQHQIQQAPIDDGGPDPRYVSQQEQHIPIQGGAFDDTLTSNIEDTTSDLNHNGGPRDVINQDGPEYNDQYEIQTAEGRNQYTPSEPRRRTPQNEHASKHLGQHSLQHKHSRSPLADANVDDQQIPHGGRPKHGIVGRFTPSVQRWQQNIPDRGGMVPGQQMKASSKRRHPDDPAYPADDGQGEYNEQQGTSPPDSDEEEYGEEVEGQSQDQDLPRPQENGRSAKQESGNGALDPRSEGAETAVSTVSHRMTRREEIDHVLDARLDDPNRSKLDYNDEQLNGMAYASLKKETWDPQASSEKRANPAGAQNPDYTFEDCVEYMVQEETSQTQVEFFEQLSVEEFEQAGDFFIEKFTMLMQKIREARKKKREIVMAFEKEIETREKAVRGKSENLDTKFNDMRAGGEGVLRGKVKV